MLGVKIYLFSAFSVRMIQAAKECAAGPDSPRFAQKCYELEHLLTLVYFI